MLEIVHLTMRYINDLSIRSIKVYKTILDSLEKSQKNELHCVKYHTKRPNFYY